MHGLPNILRETEGNYTFSDGTSFTLTGGTIGTSDATWSTGFTAWKDGQPKDDAAKQEKQDCVKVLHVFIADSFPNSFQGHTTPASLCIMYKMVDKPLLKRWSSQLTMEKYIL